MKNWISLAVKGCTNQYTSFILVNNSTFNSAIISGQTRLINKKEVILMSEEKVMKAFAEARKPLRPGEVAELAGLDKKEVEKIIKKLKAEDKIHSPKRCYYEPK